MSLHPTRGRLLAAVVAASAAVVAWVLAWPTGGVQKPPSAVAAAARPTRAALVVEKPNSPGSGAVERCPVQVGVTKGYAGQAEVQNTPAQRWQMQLRTLRAEGDGTTVVAVAPWLTDDANAPQQAPVQLVRLGRDCRQLAYAWKAAADRVQARQVQARLATFDFALPPRDGVVVHGEARDENGRYRFAAVRAQTAGQVVVHRRVVRYLNTVGTPTGLLVDGPGLRVAVGADGWPVSATLDQGVRLAAGGEGSVVVRARLSTLEGASDARLNDVDAKAADWVWGNLLADPALRDAARLGDDPRLHGMPAAEVLRLLSEADPQGEHIEAALRQLHAWLLANPDGAAQLRSWLQSRSGHYGEDTWARLALAALSRAATPAARQALRELARQQGLAPAMRLHALLNLATAEGIDRADVAAVRALADATTAEPNGLSANAALSALGAMARSDSLDPADRAAIVDSLRGALHGEKDVERLVAAINGAGNAGSAELLPELKAIGAHIDVDVRRRVADALHALPADAVQPQAAWLARWLQTETAPQVAAALATTLRLQWPMGAAVPQALLDAAKARLATETNAAVAVQLAGLLGGAVGHSQVAKQALLDRFAQEFRRGDAADAAVMQAIGAHVDAKSLMGAL